MWFLNHVRNKHICLWIRSWWGLRRGIFNGFIGYRGCWLDFLFAYLFVHSEDWGFLCYFKNLILTKKNKLCSCIPKGNPWKEKRKWNVEQALWSDLNKWNVCKCIGRPNACILTYTETWGKRLQSHLLAQDWRREYMAARRGMLSERLQMSTAKLFNAERPTTVQPAAPPSAQAAFSVLGQVKSSSPTPLWRNQGR